MFGPSQKQARNIGRMFIAGMIASAIAGIGMMGAGIYLIIAIARYLGSH